MQISKQIIQSDHQQSSFLVEEISIWWTTKEVTKNVQMYQLYEQSFIDDGDYENQESSSSRSSNCGAIEHGNVYRKVLKIEKDIIFVKVMVIAQVLISCYLLYIILKIQ